MVYIVICLNLNQNHGILVTMYDMMNSHWGMEQLPNWIRGNSQRLGNSEKILCVPIISSIPSRNMDFAISSHNIGMLSKWRISASPTANRFSQYEIKKYPNLRSAINTQHQQYIQKNYPRLDKLSATKLPKYSENVSAYRYI